MAVNLRKEVNLQKAHGRELAFVVVNAQLFEVLWVAEAVFALSCVLHEFVGQNLDDFCAVLGSIREDFPLIQIFLRMELHPEERIVFGPKSRQKILIVSSSGV